MMKKINGDALRKKAQYMDALGNIYDLVASNMKWDCMRCTEETDEDGAPVYEAPEPEENDGYRMTDYERYQVYQDVLAAIEKLAK